MSTIKLMPIFTDFFEKILAKIIIPQEIGNGQFWKLTSHESLLH